VVVKRNKWEGICPNKGRIARASPKLQLCIQTPSRDNGEFFHKKNRAGIDWEYFVLKVKSSKKGNATKYNSVATIV